MKRPGNILWIDCIGGIAIGLFVVLFHHLLTNLHSLPHYLVIAIGVVNLSYGSFSLSLVVRRKRPIILICILAAANIAWLFACCIFTFIWWKDISIFGVIHLIGEGIYVAILGLFEWRWRKDLLIN